MSDKWFPQVDLDKCAGCLQCVEFCPHDVYEVRDSKPEVARPENCVDGCLACAKLCPAGAISFPDRRARAAS